MPRIDGGLTVKSLRLLTLLPLALGPLALGLTTLDWMALHDVYQVERPESGFGRDAAPQ